MYNWELYNDRPSFRCILPCSLWNTVLPNETDIYSSLCNVSRRHLVCIVYAKFYGIIGVWHGSIMVRALDERAPCGSRGCKLVGKCLSKSVTNLWSVETRIGPLRFQAGCHRKQLNLAWVFLCLFCVVVHFFWFVNVCFCCVRCCFPHTKPRDWLGERLRNNPFCVERNVKH